MLGGGITGTKAYRLFPPETRKFYLKTNNF